MFGYPPFFDKHYVSHDIQSYHTHMYIHMYTYIYIHMYIYIHVYTVCIPMIVGCIPLCLAKPCYTLQVSPGRAGEVHGPGPGAAFAAQGFMHNLQAWQTCGRCKDPPKLRGLRNCRIRMVTAQHAVLNTQARQLQVVSLKTQQCISLDAKGSRQIWSLQYLRR